MLYKPHKNNVYLLDPAVKTGERTGEQWLTGGQAVCFSDGCMEMESFKRELGTDLKLKKNEVGRCLKRSVKFRVTCLSLVHVKMQLQVLSREDIKGWKNCHPTVKGGFGISVSQLKVDTTA